MAQPTKAEIERYLAREEERKALNRQADAIETESKLFRERLRTLIEEQGGSKQRLVHRGFLLGIDFVKGTPAWKTHFIRVAGADEAAKVSAEAPLREVL